MLYWYKSAHMLTQRHADALLGPKVAAALREPGDAWPEVDHAHVAKVAACLKAAGDQA